MTEHRGGETGLRVGVVGGAQRRSVPRDRLRVHLHAMRIIVGNVVDQECRLARKLGSQRDQLAIEPEANHWDCFSSRSKSGRILVQMRQLNRHGDQ